MLKNLIPSLIRTYVPIGVGLLLTWLGVHFHVVLSQNTSDSLVSLVTALVAAGYYGLARLLEHYVPAAGVLLGIPAAPNYGAIAKQAEALLNFGTDPLAVEGADPNTPGASATAAAAPDPAAAGAPTA